MATAGPSGYRLVCDHAEPTQSSHSSNSARQPTSCRTPLRSPSPCESLTGIPKPDSSYRRYSHTSLVFSSTTPSEPSRSCSPDSSPASSVKEASITGEDVKEPEPDLPKAPEHFTRAFSVPKALFQIYETYQGWHFSFAPTQNVHALVMELNETTLQRDKAEQQVRDLTERLSSGTEPGLKIQPSEREERSSEVAKHPASKPAFLTEPDPRQREIIENKENKPLEERFKDLVDWSYIVQGDWAAAQKRNTVLDDELEKAGKDIRKLEAKESVLENDKKRIEMQIKQSRKRRTSGQDSSTQTEGSKGEGVACQTTMVHDDQSSMTLGTEPLQPPASLITQQHRLTELQQENERLRQENDEMRNALEQHQNEDSPPEGLESQALEAHPGEAQMRSADPGVEVQGGDVEMGGITTGQDSTAPQDTETPAMPVTAPVTSETEVVLGFDPQRHLNSINRDSRTNSDDARRRRDRRRSEQRRRPEQRRLEREEEAQQPRRHRNRSHEVYTQKKKTLWPLRWVRYRRRALMDFFSFGYMFSHRLSYRSR
ncbi:hypothetical protein NW756_013083 [Fusarium oxysporum]|nr:hypothetical protein NW753_012856 [Fusarium oxysporum]KAJ4036024.1 hypothetical protein NW763_013925 [Fusarium oxysporum]KAJ4075958.1 hypothetical protein NW756_013083 [Fusarium oxysporum]KAJ4088343.1 hypothetical protein NW769_013562 [Fusarium oxysporum]KAJ4217785.1 hypothetical protein NW760_013156 [Fusarium oxysporum]